MRLCYLAPIRLADAPSIIKKVAAQTAAWVAAGHEVRLFTLGDGSGLGTLPVPVTAAPATDSDRRIADELTRQRALARTVDAILDWEPDVVYLRHTHFFGAYPRLARRTRVVLEINTHDVSEFKLYSTPLHLGNLATRRPLLRGAAATVYPTVELSVSPDYEPHHHRAEVIANGFDLSTVPEPPTGTRTPSGRPSLVLMAAELAGWHGGDHLLEIARAMPDFDFHVVGMASAERAPDNVTFHGFLAGDELNDFLAGIDAGFGSLAFYRAGLTEASPLKVRHYLAAGLPVVLPYADTDFPDPVPHVLTLPNCGSLLAAHADEIREFVLGWRDRRVRRADIAHIDWRAKETQRLALFTELVAAERAPVET